MSSRDDRKVQAFLDAVARDGIVLSARDRIRVHLLAERRPELLSPEREVELGASWASLLARSEAEYDRLEHTFRDAVGLRIDGGDSGPVFTRTQRVVMTVASFCAALAVAAILYTGRDHGGTVEPSPSPTPSLSASPTPSPTVPSTAPPSPPVRRVEVEPAREVTRTEPAPPRPLDARDVAALVLVGVALALALRLLLFLRLEPKEIVRNDAERIAEANRKRAEIEKRLLQVPVEPSPPSRYGFDPAFVLETAGELQRLTASTFGPDLDGAATAVRSAASAGLFVPVLEERTQRRTPVVVLDAEGGDYVWFGLLRRLIADWRRHGVELELFTFTAHPGELRDAESGGRARLDQLGRRARGPLLLCSRQLRLSDRAALDVGDASVPAAWLAALDAWPVKAWIDPEPGAGVMEPRAVEALARRGLRRFQANEAGLRALLRYLESEGQRYEPVELSLPAPNAPAVERALDLWRWAVAQVPTPTWDFVERIRRARPEIAEVMRTRQHVRLLLDAVDAADQGALRSAGRGSVLELTAETYRRWLAEAKDVAYRDWAVRLHSEEEEARSPKDELDAADRAMLLARNRARVERTPEAVVAFREHLFGLAGQNARIQWVDTCAMLEDEVPEVVPLAKEVERGVSLTTSWARALWAHGGAWVAALVLAGLAVGFVVLSDRGLEAAERRFAIPAIARLDLQDAGPEGDADTELDGSPGVPDARPRLKVRDDARALDSGLEDRAVNMVSVSREEAGDLDSGLEDVLGADVPTVATTLIQPPLLDDVLIPAGKFMMGSPDDEPGRDRDEGPRHEVTISRPFWLTRTEVTTRVWRAVASAALKQPPNKDARSLWDQGFKIEVDPSRYGKVDDGRLPVVNVSWYDAVAFSVLLSNYEGLSPCYELSSCSGTIGRDFKCGSVRRVRVCVGYRLPTEAEWEYAARGGTETALYSGTPSTADLEAGTSTVVDAVAWFSGNSGVRPHFVGTRVEVRHPWGLVDMLGNAMEWCDDGQRQYAHEAVADPLGPNDGARRVIRGGSWVNDARFVRAAFRDWLAPGDRLVFLGFRLARGP